MAMAAIMRDADAIQKERSNQQQGFKFRGIDDVYNALHPVFAAHGVICLPFIEKAEHRDAGLTKNGTMQTRAFVTMGYRFTASDGSMLEARTIGEGLDSGDKSTAKALSVAHKYLLLQTFLIPTADLIDGDFYDPTVMPREELEKRRQRADRDNDKAAMQEIINQHLADAELEKSPTKKSRLLGLASEMRCKLAELEDAAKKTIEAETTVEPPETANNTKPHQEAAPTTGDWRTMDFSHKNPKTTSPLFGKTVGEIYDTGSIETAQRVNKLLSGFIEGMDKLQKELEDGAAITVDPKDYALYSAIIEGQRRLEQRITEAAK